MSKNWTRSNLRCLLYTQLSMKYFFVLAEKCLTMNKSYIKTAKSWLCGSTVNVRNPNMFGFRTGDHCQVQNCFKQIKLSEIRTFCLDFRRSVEWLYMLERLDFGVYSIGMPIWTVQWMSENRTSKIRRAPKSKLLLVWFSALSDFERSGLKI